MRFAPLGLVAAVACRAGPSVAPAPVVDVSAGFFSPAQAERGRENFEARCVECHGISEFTGDDFEWSWRRQTAWNLYGEMSMTMPEDFPGDLDNQTYVDIIAYFLRVNGYAEGGPELVPTRESLSIVPLGPGATKSRNQQQGRDP